MFENFRFEHKELLWLLAIVPVMWLLTWLWAYTYKKRLKNLGNLQVIKTLMPEAALSKKVWKNIWYSIAIILLILALARPQIGIEKGTRQAKGSEIVIVMDISNSMLARKSPNDLSRLDRAKLAVYRLISKLQNDRVALVIFAGDAALVMPMTDDYEALKLYVSSLKPSYISTQGTAISDALALAINAFTPNPDVNKAIILFSDGEDLAGKADAIAQEAKQKGIRIYTAGVGSVRGNPIYLPGGKPMEYKGQIVISKQDPAYLRKLAAITSGAYVDITNRPSTIDYIYQDIEKHSTGTISAYSRYEEIFYYFVGAALLVLLIIFSIVERKTRWHRKLNIFQQ